MESHICHYSHGYIQLFNKHSYFDLFYMVNMGSAVRILSILVFTNLSP